MSHNRFETPCYAFYSLTLDRKRDDASFSRRCRVDGKWRAYTSIVQGVFDAEGKIDMYVPRKYIIDSKCKDLVFVGITQEVFC